MQKASYYNANVGRKPQSKTPTRKAPRFQRPQEAKDIIGGLLEDRVYVNGTFSCHCSLIADSVVVTPANMEGRRALAESACFTVEEFVEQYSDTLWLEISE